MQVYASCHWGKGNACSVRKNFETGVTSMQVYASCHWGNAYRVRTNFEIYFVRPRHIIYCKIYDFLVGRWAKILSKGIDTLVRTYGS